MQKKKKNCKKEKPKKRQRKVNSDWKMGRLTQLTHCHIKASTVTTGGLLVIVLELAHQGECCLWGRTPMGASEESIMMTHTVLIIQGHPPGARNFLMSKQQLCHWQATQSTLWGFWPRAEQILLIKRGTALMCVKIIHKERSSHLRPALKKLSKQNLHSHGFTRCV